jgi:NADH-ubiquinone oxidoreductase chain 4
MFVLVLLSFFSAAFTSYLYSYSQHGSIYSGLYSCSLGYVHEFSLLILHWFPLNLIILKVDVTVFWVGFVVLYHVGFSFFVGWYFIYL